jgi:arylsulfatase
MRKPNKYALLICLFPLLIQAGKLSKTQSAASPLHPNIIIIFMDDMGYGDVGVYERHTYSTPNIDKLAANGMRFTNFYAAQAVCSASRASLLTGCYPNRLGISGALMPWTDKALNNNEETIANLLKEAGYKTGMVGKWHLGSKEPHLPLNFGFDEWLGLPYSNDMWPVGYDGKPITDTTDYKFRYPPLPLMDGNKTIQYINTLDDQAQISQTYTKRAVSFIQKNKDNPFFLYVAYSSPHVPIAASAAFKGKSKAGLYGDVIEELDWSVGEIVNSINSNGLSKNSIIIFTSDNGPWLTFGNHAGSSGGLREGKGTTWEGGQKEPFIVQWKGIIQPGSVCNKIASTIDLLPTLTSICHTRAPKLKIDGLNIKNLFTDPIHANPRDEFVYYYDKNNLKAIRKGKWKLVFPHVSQTYTNPGAIGKDGYPGKTANIKIEMALYNLDIDPNETTDVKAAHPDTVKLLQTIADNYRKDLGDDLTGTTGTGTRPAAKL